MSSCGARLFAPPGVYGGTCASFDAAEARVLGAFREIEPQLCAKLKGVIVSMQPTAAWTDDFGRRIAGATRCERRSIQVGAAPWREGAYAHELRHWVSCPSEDRLHKGWGPADWAAIDLANAAAVQP